MRASEIEYFRKAEVDLRCAQILAAHDDSYFAEKICTDCQLAAEKYLKAAIVAANVDHTKTHSLPALLALFLPLDQTLWLSIAEDCDLLNDRLSLRYAGTATSDEGMEALRRTERIARLSKTWIEDRL